MGFPALVEIHLDAVVADKRLAHFRVGSRCTSKLRAFPVNLNASRDPTAGLGTALVGSRDPDVRPYGHGRKPSSEAAEREIGDPNCLIPSSRSRRSGVGLRQKVLKASTKGSHHI